VAGALAGVAAEDALSVCGERAEMLDAHYQHSVEQVMLLVPQEHGALTVDFEVGCGLLLVKRRADAAYRHGVSELLGQGVDLGAVPGCQAADDMGGVR
jgi:hypothetical protein